MLHATHCAPQPLTTRNQELSIDCVKQFTASRFSTGRRDSTGTLPALLASVTVTLPRSVFVNGGGVFAGWKNHILTRSPLHSKNESSNIWATVSNSLAMGSTNSPTTHGLPHRIRCHADQHHACLRAIVMMRLPSSNLALLVSQKYHSFQPSKKVRVVIKKGRVLLLPLPMPLLRHLPVATTGATVATSPTTAAMSLPRQRPPPPSATRKREEDRRRPRS